MQGYDGTQQFYSPNPYQDLQLIEYGKMSNNQILPTDDTGTTFVDKNGNRIIRIVGKDKAGNKVVSQYRLINVENTMDIPKLQPIEGLDGQELHLDKLTQESIGSAMFHAQNYNLDEIEKAINILLKNQAISDDNINKMKDFFNGLSKEQLEQISINLSNMINEDYYPKDIVDKKINDLDRRITNIQNAIQYKPDKGGVFPPSYTGDKNIDINDDISDAQIAQKISELDDFTNTK